MPEKTPDQARIEAWVKPLDGADGPAGKDLEYENDFLQLVKAAQGQPETQFSPAEPPNWRAVRDMAEELLDRTRDVRVALLWLRASVCLDGFFALGAGVSLLQGLLTVLWDHVHPLPDADDGDTYARANALASLPQADGLLGDLRQSQLFNLRGVGELRMRSVELGLGLLAAKPDETATGKEQLLEMVAAAHAQNPALREQAQAALEGLTDLSAVMNERLGVVNAPDTRGLLSLVKSVCGMFPEPAEAVAALAGGAESDALEPAARAATRGQLAGQVQSREEALRAIDMVCEYLDRTEPSNPAQLLLRRARRLINQNFLQLMKELAPDALNEVARLMGVDPESVSLEN